MNNSRPKKQKTSRKSVKTAASIDGPKAGNVIKHPNLKAKSSPKKKSKPTIVAPSKPPITPRPTFKNTSTSTAKSTSKTKRSQVRKPAKSSPVKMLKTAPKTDLYYQLFPLINLIKYWILQYLRNISKDAAIHNSKTPILVPMEKQARLLTQTRKKELMQYLSLLTLRLPPDDRPIVWDFLKNGKLPVGIRLDYTDLPDEFFMVPVTAKVRAAIRALLIMGYLPSEIVVVLSEAYPGLHFSLEAILHYRYFYWDTGNLMDTAEGQASFLNRLMKIKSDILSGQNYLHHIENLTALGKTTEIEILKTLMQNRKIEQDEV